MGRPPLDRRQVPDGVDSTHWLTVARSSGSLASGSRFGAYSMNGMAMARLMQYWTNFEQRTSMQVNSIVSCGVSMERSSGQLGAPRAVEKSNPQEPGDQALGRSRGGFSTKIHVACDGSGLPLQFHLTGGQVHETQALDELLSRTDEAVVDLDNRKVACPLALAGDKGYRAVSR